MADVERHELPNGSVLFYRDSSHSYWQGYNPETGKCSGRIPGISTIAKCDGSTNNDGLLDWAAKLSCVGVERLFDSPSSAVLMPTGGQLWETLKQHKLTWRDIRNEAGTRGSFSHQVLEDLASGRVPRITSDYDRAVIRWWEVTKPVPSHVEQVVYSREHGFAGRFDLLTQDGSLCDLKTSKYIGASFAIQLNLYRIAAIESGIPEPTRLAVIHVREDGSWREVEIPINEEWALTALRSYKAGKAIGSALRQAEKQAVVA